MAVLATLKGASQSHPTVKRKATDQPQEPNPPSAPTEVDRRSMKDKKQSDQQEEGPADKPTCTDKKEHKRERAKERESEILLSNEETLRRGRVY